MRFVETFGNGLHRAGAGDSYGIDLDVEATRSRLNIRGEGPVTRIETREYKLPPSDREGAVPVGGPTGEELVKKPSKLVVGARAIVSLTVINS